MSDQLKSKALRLNAARRIALIYALAAAAWIVGSDLLVYAATGEAQSMAASIAKGLLFVAVTAALVYALTARALVTVDKERTRFEALGQHLDLLSRYANDIILLIDAEGRIVKANERASEKYGFGAEELIGLPVSRLRSPQETSNLAERLERIWRNGSDIHESLHMHRDGRGFPVEISGRKLAVGGARYIQAIIRDIGARKAAEAHIQRLAQTKDALSAVNRAIIHIGDEETLYREICRIVVERAQFRLAWIGLVDRDTGWVRAVAQAGDAEPYVAALRISVDEALPEGRGLIAQAIRTGNPMISQDFANDARRAAPPELIRRWHLGSEAVIPVRRDGVVIGSLNVYARDPGAFDDEYSHLLLELASDLSFALGNMARNRELQQSEARFRALLEQSVAAVYVIQDGRIVYANPRMREIFGYTTDEPFDPDPLKHVDASDRAMVIDQIARRLQDQQHASYSLPALRRDGSRFRFGISAQLANYLGKPAIIAIGQDITEKERAEAEQLARLQRAQAHLEALNTVTMSEHLTAGNVDAFSRELTEAAAKAAGVERANAWLFNDTETELRCIDLYEATPSRHTSGALLTQAQFGPEFAALKNASYVDAHEPLTDARTAGYAESYLKPLRITSMLDAVVRLSGKNLGLLCLEHVDCAHRWEQDEISFACHLADKFGLAIANGRRARAQRKLRRSLEDSIQAIAATVEARDPYTAGHEQRVAAIAAAIGTEMGLPAARVEGIHFGSLIHDLGKIRIPAEILSKPTRLMPVEYELIKGHAQAGYDILKGIDFPWPAAEMALQHHERMDGSGYPQGLKGDAIILEARVLAVADTVEAMASHRPYRPGLGIEKALTEIEKGRGIIFDVLVADACLRLFREKGYTLPA